MVDLGDDACCVLYCIVFVDVDLFDFVCSLVDVMLCSCCFVLMWYSMVMNMQ